MFFNLGLSLIVSGASAFAAWALRTITVKNYFDFGQWYIFFYVMAGAIALAGIIDFVRNIIYLCRRLRGRSGGTTPRRRRRRRG